jgi:hypothetical protein
LLSSAVFFGSDGWGVSAGFCGWLEAGDDLGDVLPLGWPQPARKAPSPRPDTIQIKNNVERMACSLVLIRGKT